MDSRLWFRSALTVAAILGPSVQAKGDGRGAAVGAVAGGGVVGGRHGRGDVGGGPVLVAQPFFIIAPVPVPMMTFGGGGGLMLPSPNQVAPAMPAANRPRALPVRRASPARAAELLTLGDRLFRADNLKKAEDRYVQAAKADPNAAAPFVRLAQLALVRGQYAKAADHFRTAEAVEPGWLVNSSDIQALYGEPEDFAKILAKLETQIQAHPNDRDARFLLGAQLFLSGRVQRAKDLFVGLNDRKVDDAVAAFLEAATPNDPAVEK